MGVAAVSRRTTVSRQERRARRLASASVASVIVDFDGTASPLDDFVELCRRFVGDDWERHFAQASWKGAATHRTDMRCLARLVRAPRDELALRTSPYVDLAITTSAGLTNKIVARSTPSIPEE